MDDKTLNEAIERMIAARKRERQLLEAERLQQMASTIDNTTTEPSREPPEQSPVSDEDLPLQTLHDLMWAYERFVLTFAPASTMQLEIPSTHTPGPINVAMVPWIIEAPLNSIEILEAILRSSHPFEIHTARHVRRGCTETALTRRHPARSKKLHSEYLRLQGRLELDRDISFICVPRTAIDNIRHRLFGVFTPVLLQYISIPWPSKAESKYLVHPWAPVLHDKSYPRTSHTYENRFRDLIEELGLSGNQFRRSLLRHGTTPVPECLWDWFAGRPGTTAALPYFASAEEVDANRKVTEATHEGMPGVVAPCCLPMVKKS
jgi:hypothetical protein